ESRLPLPRVDGRVRPRQYRQRRLARASRRARVDVVDDSFLARAAHDLDLAGGPARDAGDLAAVVPSAWAEPDDCRRARNTFLTVTVTVTEPSRKRMKPGEERAVDRGDELIGNRAELVG